MLILKDNNPNKIYIKLPPKTLVVNKLILKENQYVKLSVSYHKQKKHGLFYY